MSGKAVIGIVNNNGKILIGKKRSDSKKFLRGEWHIPGETLEKGETDESALIRGIRDEAGINIKVGRYLGSHTTSTQKEARWYECFSETDKLIPGSDLEEARWVLKDQVLRFCGERAVSLWPQEIIDYFSN